MKLLILLAICSSCVVALSASDPLKVDLVFAVDRSDNLHMEDGNIRSQIERFLDGLSNQEKTHIEKYALVTFTTNENSNLTSSTDVQSFKTSLYNIKSDRVRRGENLICQGKSLTGIKKGLESTSSNSIIIVFTDGVEGDGSELQDIKKKIAATHSKVIFVLVTDPCNASNSTAYQEIALFSNGLIFNIPKNNITNIIRVLKSIQSSIGPQRVNLLVADGQPKSGGKVDFTIPVSENFRDLLITVSADNSLVPVHLNDTKNKCENIYDQTICKIEKPIAGNYTINVTNITSTYHIRVSATSNLTFQYGFQTFEDEDLNAKQVYSQPAKDANNTFVVKFTQPSLIKTLNSVEIVLVNNSQIITPIPLISANNNTVANNGVYYASFEVPDSKVHLKISGKTNKNENFEVMTPSVLSPYAENEKNNYTTNEISYHSLQELIHGIQPNIISNSTNLTSTTSKPDIQDSTSSEPTTPKNNSGQLNCSSFFMTALALLFFVAKSTIYN